MQLAKAFLFVADTVMHRRYAMTVFILTAHIKWLVINIAGWPNLQASSGGKLPCRPQ